MAYSFEQKTHKSKGRAGKKPHPVGASPHSGARKNKLTDALRKREADLAKRKIKPKKKPKRRSATRGSGQTSGADVIIDYEQLENLRPKKYGGKIIYKMTGGQVVDASYD